MRKRLRKKLEKQEREHREAELWFNDVAQICVPVQATIEYMGVRWIVKPDEKAA